MRDARGTKIRFFDLPTHPHCGAARGSVAILTPTEDYDEDKKGKDDYDSDNVGRDGNNNDYESGEDVD